jgi:hypothetical protein
LRIKSQATFRGEPQNESSKFLSPKPGTFEFSQPLGAFTHLKPVGLVSCQIRSWDFSFRAFFPRTQQPAVSSDFTLLMLEDLFVFSAQ